MKKLFYFFSISITLLFFNSCNNDDGYSLDKFWVARATVDSISPGVYSFTLDDGTTLWPAAGNIYNYYPRNGQRAYINYTILSDKIDKYDHYIRLNDLYNILTKNIVTLTGESTDVYGDDPVEILKINVSGGYLNVNFGFNYGGGQKHLVNLVKNTLAEHPDNDKIYLEFRHNAYDDAATIGVKSSASFRLESLKQEGKSSVDLVIRVKTFDGMKEYPLTFNWNEQLSERKTSDWTVYSSGIQ